VTHHAATALFFSFGLRSLYQSVFAWDGGGEELAEVEKELGENKKGGNKKRALGLLSPVLVEVFTLTFLAEWGDRSQIATIGLAASSNVFGVTLGGCLGHAVCTGAAVAGGKGMATMISERAVAVRPQTHCASVA
jgi:putative Ca2+/H+ antiporter (TMEM165/GDT1 family)